MREKLINTLCLYRTELKRLLEKEAKEQGKDCFKFDTEPFDVAIAILNTALGANEAISETMENFTTSCAMKSWRKENK